MTLRDKRFSGMASCAVLGMALLMTAMPAGADVLPQAQAAQPNAAETKPAILMPNGNDTTTTQYDASKGFLDKVGDLSGMLVIIPQKEMAEFSQPGGDRHLDRVSRAEPGASLAIKLVFTGVKPDANGVANLTYDLKVLGPDGTVYSKSDYHSLPALIGQIGPGDVVYDNRDKVVLLQFEPGDMIGAYTIRAVLHDRIAKVDLPMQAKVELVPKMVTPAPVATPEPAASVPAAASDTSSSAAPAATTPSTTTTATPAATTTKSKHRKKK